MRLAVRNLVYFARTVRRVLLDLLPVLPPSAPSSVRLTFLGPLGEFLGSEEVNIREEPIVRRQSDHPAGIAEIVIDYGEDPREEVLQRLGVDYDDPFRLSQSVAQIAGTEGPGGRSLHTRLRITGGGGGIVRFYEPSGSPLQLRVSGELRSEMTIEKSRYRLPERRFPGPFFRWLVHWPLLTTRA